MKKFTVVLLVLLLLPMAMLFSLRPSTDYVAAYVAVTDTPVSPTETPVVPTDTPGAPTNTPSVPTNTPVAPTNTPDGSTPPPATDTPPPDNDTVTPDADTPGESTTPEPIQTPTTIPALGSGPNMMMMVLFGAGLIILSVLISLGWIRVWKSYR